MPRYGGMGRRMAQQARPQARPKAPARPAMPQQANERAAQQQRLQADRRAQRQAQAQPMARPQPQQSSFGDKAQIGMQQPQTFAQQNRSRIYSRSGSSGYKPMTQMQRAKAQKRQAVQKMYQQAPRQKSRIYSQSGSGGYKPMPQAQRANVQAEAQARAAVRQGRPQPQGYVASARGNPLGNPRTSQLPPAAYQAQVGMQQQRPLAGQQAPRRRSRFGR